MLRTGQRGKLKAEEGNRVCTTIAAIDEIRVALVPIKALAPVPVNPRRRLRALAPDTDLVRLLRLARPVNPAHRPVKHEGSSVQPVPEVVRHQVGHAKVELLLVDDESIPTSRITSHMAVVVAILQLEPDPPEALLEGHLTAADAVARPVHGLGVFSAIGQAPAGEIVAFGGVEDAEGVAAEDGEGVSGSGEGEGGVFQQGDSVPLVGIDLVFSSVDAVVAYPCLD